MNIFCLIYNVFVFVFVVLAQNKTSDKHYFDNGEYHCNSGEFPDVLRNLDGFLELQCHSMDRPCEYLQYKAICDSTWREWCPPRFFVSAIKGYYIGTRKHLKYDVQCCTHPILQSHYYLGDTQRDLHPVDGFDSSKQNKINTILEYITSIDATRGYIHQTRDHQYIKTGRFRCEQRSSTTQTPQTTNKANDDDDGPKDPFGTEYDEYLENTKNESPKQEEKVATQDDPSLYQDYYALYGDYPEKKTKVKPFKAIPNLNPFPQKPPPTCFPPHVLVQTKSGTKRMDEVEIGDEVLSSLVDGTVALFEPVLYFLHRNYNITTEFIRIKTENGQQITLSPKHLLPIFPCASTNVFSFQSIWDSFVFAERASPGLCVLTQDDNGEISQNCIHEVSRVASQGIFAPITGSGTIVVNGVQASCYSNIQNQYMQHAFFTSAYKLATVKNYFLDRFWSFVNDGNSKTVYDVPLIVKLLLYVSELVLGPF